MKLYSLEKFFMMLGLFSAIINVYENFHKGFNVYAWPFATAMWILVAWMKLETIKSLNKNK